jgi:uncharacterized protein
MGRFPAQLFKTSAWQSWPVKKILADTNFLLMQFEYGVDLPGELLRIVHEPFALLVCSGTMGEIRMLAGKAGRKAAGARFVLNNLELLKSKFQVEVAESRGPVDEWIFKFAKENQVCVATNDVPLRRRLLEAGVPVIAMKGKSKLDFV